MTRKVGYKSPPEHAQFKPGQSGNPKGRKKGSTNVRTDLEAELSEVIQISEGGQPRRISKQRAVVKALTARAIKGDARAAHTLLTWIERLLGVAKPEEAEAPLDAVEQAALDALLDRRMEERAASKKEAGQ